MHRATAAIVAFATSSACVTWRTVDEHVELRPGIPAIELRRDVVPGVPHVLDDGRVDYAIDLDSACREVTHSERVRDVARHRWPTPVGFAAIGGSMLLIVATPFLGLPMLFAAGGGALFVGTAVQLDGKHAPAHHDIIVEPVNQTRIAACKSSEVAAFGELVLTAPWGEQVAAHVGDFGDAAFAVDWARARDGVPASGWHVEAEATGAVADFALSPADQSRASAHVHALRTP